MILNFPNYFDQTQALGLQTVLSYSGYGTPYPLLIALSEATEFGINLAKSVEFRIVVGNRTEYNISLSKSSGGSI